MNCAHCGKEVTANRLKGRVRVFCGHKCFAIFKTGKPMERKPAKDRFWSKVQKGAPGECWQWTGAVQGGGYGSFRVGAQGSKIKQAHIVAFELLGIVIPPGMVIDHTCRNRLCVSPYHLRVVTPRMNGVENSTSPAARNAAKTHCVKGHPLSGDNLVWVEQKARSGRLSPTRRCLICYPKAIFRSIPPPNYAICEEGGQKT